MRQFIISGLAAAALMAILPNTASARFYDPALTNAAPVVEQAACRTVRTRTYVRGRVVYKTVRRCGVPAYHRRHCWTARERVRTPVGTFVFKSVRRCR
jgi:hypothetical protein